MTRTLLAAAVALAATAAAAQMSPGEQFMTNFDLDGDGTATRAELREMRGNIHYMFDRNEDGVLDAEEYVAFDEARAADVANYEGEARARMQRVADGMALEAADLDGDGTVSEAEFLAGADAWFDDLDRNDDGGVTLEDFGRP